MVTDYFEGSCCLHLQGRIGDNRLLWNTGNHQPVYKTHPSKTVILICNWAYYQKAYYHILPVPFNFLVGPERAGNWDVRGHRHYAGLLQAATRNSIESPLMLQISVRQRFTSFSHYSIPNHIIFLAMSNLLKVHLNKSTLFWQNNFEIMVFKVQTSFSILKTGTATTSIILSLVFPEFFHHSLSIAGFIMLFIILPTLSLKESYILETLF